MSSNEHDHEHRIIETRHIDLKVRVGILEARMKSLKGSIHVLALLGGIIGGAGGHFLAGCSGKGPNVPNGAGVSISKTDAGTEIDINLPIHFAAARFDGGTDAKGE